MAGPDPLPPPVSLEKWLENTDTGDILRDMAVVEVTLAQVLGQMLNLQKEGIRDLSNKIKEINGLVDRLREDRPRFKKDNTTPADANEEGALGDSAFESQAVIDMLRRFGVEVKDTDITKTTSGPWTVKQATFNVWIEGLQGKSDRFASDSQQEQTLIQQTLGRMNTALDAGSSLTRKRGEIGDNVVR